MTVERTYINKRINKLSVLNCDMFDGAYCTDWYIQHTGSVHNAYMFAVCKFWLEVVYVY